MTHSILVPVCEANLPDLMVIGAELMALSQYKAPFDATWSTGIARGAMADPRFFGRMAMLDDGSYCGLIVGSVTTMLFSPAIMAVEETIYVREGTKYRASIAKQLLDALTRWAFNSKGASFIRAGETSAICPKAVDAFFRSQGFKRSGTLYCKEKAQ